MAGYLTTHVLDTSAGKPAEGISISLYRVSGTIAGSSSGTAVIKSDGTNLELSFFNASTAVTGAFNVWVDFNGVHLW